MERKAPEYVRSHDSREEKTEKRKGQQWGYCTTPTSDPRNLSNCLVPWYFHQDILTMKTIS